MIARANAAATLVPDDLSVTGDRARARPPRSIALRQDDVRNGLGKLVLTVVELVRDLVERQAIRRLESGSLTADEVERLGATLMQLSEEMARLKEIFGLDQEDLNIDLGPLGKLL